MDGTQNAVRPSRRKRLVWVALVGGGLLTGLVLAGTQVAAAQGSSSNATPSVAPSGSAAVDPTTMKHGPGETLLTDGTADKVRAAALDAVPGGSIIRVETDSDGSAYEAHVEKADGSIVTVKLDKDFNVTDIETGFGGGPGAPPSSGSNA